MTFEKINEYYFALIYKNFVIYPSLITTTPWRKYRIGIHSELMRIIPNHSEKRFTTR